MRWYHKTITPRTSNIILYSSLCILLIVGFFDDRNERYKLYACSLYTIGKISRVYSVRGQVRINYSYQLNAKTVQITSEGVNNFDTNESWTVDMSELSKRRLLVRVYCNDINVNRIVWDAAVPDTLRHVPVQGWKEMPFMTSN